MENETTINSDNPENINIPETLDEPNYRYKDQAEAEAAHSALEKKLGERAEEFQQRINQYKAPEQYSLPEGLNIDATTQAHLEKLAHQGGFTQKQFDVVVSDLMAANADTAAQREALIKEVTPEKLESVTTFINKHYPSTIAPRLIESLRDKGDVNYFLEQREKSIAGVSPTITAAAAPRSISHTDIQDIQRKMANEPHVSEHRDNFIKMMEAKAKNNEKI